MTVKALKKQLMAAIAMVVVSAIALSSSTYAWFAAANTVTAKGMQVTAKAESGIVIKDANDNTAVYGTIANITMESVELMPISTINLSQWYHAVSDLFDDAKAQQAQDKYAAVTTNLDNYRLVKTFSIKSATASAVTNTKLGIGEVLVTNSDSLTGSPNLDKAVRVGVKVNNSIFIYAPAEDSNFVLHAVYSAVDSNNNSTIDEDEIPTLTEKTAANIETDLFTLENNQIPSGDAYLTAEIYMWFEGEDANCKSSNVTASMDSVNVSVSFTAVPIS